MPAVRVKTEQIERRALTSNDLTSSSSLSSDWDTDRQGLQHVLGRSARIRDNASPYRYLDPPSHHQLYQAQVHQAALAHAIAQANHETLLGTRNNVYLCALQEISQLRAVASTYQRQATNLSKELWDTRNAYTQLLAQIKIPRCQKEPQVQEEHRQELNASEGGASVATPIFETRTSVPSLAPCKLEQRVATPGPGPAMIPPVYESYGPVSFPEGFRVIPHAGPWITASQTRPSDLPFEVFWNKADWLGKGYANGTFVTDRNGEHLKHLMKGIRKTTRKIWTELERRPGGWVAATFNTNDVAFMSSYVNTIEAIYPCLKLCNLHWKAKRIGCSAYSHWYKNRSRY